MSTKPSEETTATRRPSPNLNGLSPRLPGDPTPEVTTFDTGSLFPGLTVANRIAWMEQDRQEAQDREALIRQIERAEKRRP
jgi:hypothetical protein